MELKDSIPVDSNNALPEIPAPWIEGFVPAELLDSQWVNWKYEQRDGKATKVPLTTSGMHASHSNPATWGVWEKVCGNAEANTGSVGVGRVLSADDPYFMLDLDDAYALYFDGEMVRVEIAEWAEPWVEFARAFGLYIEVSPSGTGLKIIGKGTLPGTGRRHEVKNRAGEKIGEFELYDRTRFTTITGDVIGSPIETVGDGQDLIDKLLKDVFPPERQTSNVEWESTGLTDSEVVVKALNDKTGAQFRKWWSGDYSEFADDESRAEWNIIKKLNFYTGDPEQTERIVRNNPNIARSKWDTHRTYLVDTITKAEPDEFYTKPSDLKLQVSPSPSLKDRDTGDTCGTTLEYPKIKVVDVGKSTRPQGSQPFLVADVMPENYPTVFFGDSGTVKSTLAGHLAQCVAHGVPWMGHETKQTKVLTLDFELDEDTHNRRAHDTAKGMGYHNPADGLHYIECAGFSPRDVFAYALDFCKENSVGLLIIDSLGVALEGDAEAARDVIGFMRAHVDQFRAAGITTLIIDHQGKLQSGERYQGKTQFGSAYKKHLSRSVFQIETRESTEVDRKITFRQTKTNFGPGVDPFGVKVTWEHEKTTIEADELTQADLAEEYSVPVIKRIITELEDGPKYPDELADALGVEVKTVKNRLSILRKEGKIEDTGEKHKQARQVSLVSPAYRDGDGDTRT